MKELKKLFPYMKPYKWQFALALFFGVLMAGSQSSMVWVVKNLFDKVFYQHDKSYLILIPLAVIGLRLLHGVARYFHLFILKMASERVCVKIQQDLQSKYMNLNLSFYNRSDTGGLISKVISDVNIILHGFKIMADFVREPLTIMFVFSYLIYLDWKLTLMISAIAPIIIIILTSLAKSIRKYSHYQQETVEMLTSTLKETVDGIRIIQSFNLQKELSSRLKKVVDTYIKTRKRVISRQEGAGPIAELLAATAFAGVIYYMGSQVIGSVATVGDVMAFLAGLAIIQAPIKKIQDGMIRIQQPIASVERVFAILESGDIVYEVEHPKPFPEDWDTIEFNDISFSYGTEPVLKNVNLTVKRGEIVALVGESGSGKSTLVNILERFFDPQDGEIRIGDVPIREIGLNDLRKNIALVTQDVFLFNDTIARNIQSGDFDREDGDIPATASMANAHGFVAAIPEGYETMAGDRGGRLSGGEKQRISIARAIYKNAPVLILDEATSALDSVSELEVQKGLDHLMAGRTAFVIAHRLSTVANADRIIVLNKGEIVEMGSHRELMDQKGHYFQYHQLQTQAASI